MTLLHPFTGGSSEQAQFDAQVQEVERWWKVSIVLFFPNADLIMSGRRAGRPTATDFLLPLRPAARPCHPIPSTGHRRPVSTRRPAPTRPRMSVCSGEQSTSPTQATKWARNSCVSLPALLLRPATLARARRRHKRASLTSSVIYCPRHNSTPTSRASSSAARSATLTARASPSRLCSVSYVPSQSDSPPARSPVRLDPVQVTQMAKHLETVYVSGWQSSSTASSTNEPGPDLAGAFRTRTRPHSTRSHCTC